jgi:hypothetical protein
MLEYLHPVTLADARRCLFLSDLERSLKVWRITPTLQRLHALPPKNHSRPLGRFAATCVPGPAATYTPPWSLTDF